MGGVACCCPRCTCRATRKAPLSPAPLASFSVQLLLQHQVPFFYNLAYQVSFCLLARLSKVTLWRVYCFLCYLKCKPLKCSICIGSSSAAGSASTVGAGTSLLLQDPFFHDRTSKASEPHSPPATTTPVHFQET